MEQLLFYLNNNKLFTGCAMIVMNIGGRYISKDLPRSLDNIFKHIWIRRLVIFCIAFIATHDIKISLLITLSYILIFSILLNENSGMCILPESYLDFDEDGVISTEELVKAKNILDKYKKHIYKNKN
jgi:hypothetical protein